MPLEIDTTDFYRTINFYKRRQNWQEILLTAAENVADDILLDAQDNASSQFPNSTGRLERSIDVDVVLEGDWVTVTLSSSHPAARAIEYGHYYTAIEMSSELRRYAELYQGERANPYALRKAIEKNQPFQEARPFLNPAMSANLGAIESEVHRAAKQLGP